LSAFRHVERYETKSNDLIFRNPADYILDFGDEQCVGDDPADSSRDEIEDHFVESHEEGEDAADKAEDAADEAEDA
jgi:hypothetical protein